MGSKEHSHDQVEWIAPGSLVVLIHPDPALPAPGLVTKTIGLTEVEVYWNENFPKEIEYITQLRVL